MFNEVKNERKYGIIRCLFNGKVKSLCPIREGLRDASLNSAHNAGNHVKPCLFIFEFESIPF